MLHSLLVCLDCFSFPGYYWSWIFVNMVLESPGKVLEFWWTSGVRTLDSDTRLFSMKEGTASPPHSLSILIRVKPWVIVIRVKQWLEKRLASIHILGLQSEAVYGYVITQFSWMGRLPHFLSYGALKRRAWSSMHSISFMCIHVPFQKKKMKAKPIQKWIQQCK